MTAITYGWHFTGSTLRDGSPIPRAGKWLRFTGPIQICESGLHGSPTPWDALQYAPGNLLHYCAFRDVVAAQSDKFVARERKIIASMNAEDALRYFARMQALAVIDLWQECPPDCVLDYLMTGDEELRAAARTASAAAWTAASAASAAAWTAASAASAASAARTASAASAASAARTAARDDFNASVYECFGHDAPQ